MASAQLMVSELVTNAVLYAGTDIEVGYELLDGRARFEVADASPEVPVLKDYGPDAATGRGLLVVRALATDWGIRLDEDSKSVWFEILDDDPSRVPDHREATAPAGAKAGDGAESKAGTGARLAAGARATDAAGGTGPESASVTISFLGIPLAVYLASQQHSDAMLREFALIADHHSDDIPVRLLDLVEEVQQRFAGSGGTEAMRARTAEAVERADATFDISLTVPADGWELLARLTALLEEADNFCRSGALLTLASPPGVRQFRRWYTAQIANQLAGGAPRAWPGG